MVSYGIMLSLCNHDVDVTITYKVPHLLCRAMRKQLDMQADIIYVLGPPQLFTTRIVNYIGDFPNLAPEGVCPSAWFWNAAEVYISVSSRIPRAAERIRCFPADTGIKPIGLGTSPHVAWY